MCRGKVGNCAYSGTGKAGDAGSLPAFLLLRGSAGPALGPPLALDSTVHQRKLALLLDATEAFPDV